ncbi:retrovirus-related pol polyprotein from transposon TNT 1-94 [Tanacetum coccineum]
MSLIIPLLKTGQIKQSTSSSLSKDKLVGRTELCLFCERLKRIRSQRYRITENSIEKFSLLFFVTIYSDATLIDQGNLHQPLLGIIGYEYLLKPVHLGLPQHRAFLSCDSEKTSRGKREKDGPVTIDGVLSFGRENLFYQDNGTEFVNQTLREYYEKVDISHETFVARSPQQNGIVKRRNRTLIEAACTMLIYAKASLFLWAEAVATACYTQNRSIIRLRHGKTPYELLHDKLPDLSFFHVFGAFCYPTNNSENLDFDELAAMASEHGSSGPALHESQDSFVPPSRTSEVISPIAEVVAPEPAASTGSPSSTTVDQDAPSPSNSQTTPETQSPIIPNDVEENNHGLDVAHINDDPFFGIPIPENDSKASSSSDVIPTVVQTAAPNSEHVTKWTKDHPLENIISEFERHVSIRLQLHEQALLCYYDAFLTSVKPKNYKDTLT